jgi:hypothetical protein
MYEKNMVQSSVHRVGGTTYALCTLEGQQVLGVFGPEQAGRGFSGSRRDAQALFCPLDHGNAERLRQVLAYTAPSPLAGLAVTFGVGDRLGAAGPGHLRVLRQYEAAPVLAQQSVRELDLLGRTYEQVLDAATWAVFREGYQRPWGADGDHLKSEDWVRTALKVGFTMITADVSDYISKQPDSLAADALRAAYAGLDEAYRRRIEKSYLPLKLRLDTGEQVSFTEESLARTALIYREAIEHAGRLYRAGLEVKGESGFDFELSVDETETPTSPEAHAFVALEARAAGLQVSSLAPRFIGEFQKGIDYIGDLPAFRVSLRTHAALARELGHRLSIHSGSDKFSVFSAIGSETRGRFHIKTSGTSWLEAVRMIAAEEPAVFRELHRRALAGYEAARRYYHVTPDLAKLPDPERLSDAELPRLLEQADARRVLHITYGELLREAGFKERFFQALESHLEEYWAMLQRHIGRHLELLRVARSG